MEVECDFNNHRVDHSLSLGNGLDGDTHPRLSSPLRATGTTAIKTHQTGRGELFVVSRSVVNCLHGGLP